MAEPPRADDPLRGVPLRYWSAFLDTPPTDPALGDARVVVLPVPYDSTTSYRVGARYGPPAIIAASRELEFYDLELDRDISTVGIFTTPELEPHLGSPEAMVERVRGAVESLASDGKLVALLGGEHTITIGAVQALSRLHPDLSVLYLDAHADLRDEYQGTRCGHASVARRLREVCKIAQVGVRAISREERLFLEETDIHVAFWPPPDADIERTAFEVLAHLPDPIYVSIDLDVLDPSIMPAVGNPEPGGMNWMEITALLRAVARHRRIVGFDVTELSPEEGPEACTYTAAKLVYKLIGYATA